MTLVERFIEITEWPDSRKTALLSGMLIPFFLLAWWMVLRVGERVGFFDMTLVTPLFATWNAALAFVFIASLACAWAGWNASWTVYLLGAVQIGFMYGTAYLYGSSTSVLAAMPFVSIFVIMALYDARKSWAIFGMALLVITAIGWLEASGRLPYAPILLDRSVDAQNQPRWYAFGYYSVGVATAWCLFFGSLAVGARRLHAQRLAQAQALIRRYVPSQVADSILTGHQAAVEKHERRKLTIFFSDLVGFTDISEEMEPEDLSRVLNEYFSEMTRIAGKHGGTVDELAGDAVLIFFGAPTATDDKDHALRAVRMAAEMQQAVTALNAKWKSAGIDVTLKVRMGLNTGVVTIGNFGSPERMKYTALGKHVNIAARLQTHCEPGRMLLSHATWLLVQDQIACTPKGELTLKGIVKPVMAYESV